MLNASLSRYMGNRDMIQDDTISKLQPRPTVTTGTFIAGVHYFYSDTHARIGYHRNGNNVLLVVNTLSAYTGGHLELKYLEPVVHVSNNNTKRFIWSGTSQLAQGGVYYIGGTGDPPVSSDNANAPTAFNATTPQDVNAFVILGNGLVRYDVEIKVGIWVAGGAYSMIVKKY